VKLDWTVLPTTAVITPGTCQDQTLVNDSAGAYAACTATADGGRTTVELWIKIDKTPPALTGAVPGRPPDGNGWYRAPVAIAFRGTDATSGVSRCTTATYAGPDNGAARVAGNCVDVAGNASAASAFGLRYDATGPNVTDGRPARKPDHNRWYNHPVTWRFRGKDGLSGLAECPPLVYRGPDSRAARVVGACRDKAGNVSTRIFVMRYDGTAPAPPSVRVIPRDRAVRLSIHAAPGTRRIAIVRKPGVGGHRDSTLYRGRPRGFTDKRVANGRRYHYTVIARDRAANRSRTRVSAVPRARLISPANGAVVSAPPLLRWTPIQNADYYNVQLRRDGHKVLSEWPARPRLQLQRTWHYGGHVRHLSAGTYRWDVWPGYGSRSSARYGRKIGSRTFVIPEAAPAR